MSNYIELIILEEYSKQTNTNAAISLIENFELDAESGIPMFGSVDIMLKRDDMYFPIIFNEVSSKSKAWTLMALELTRIVRAF